MALAVFSLLHALGQWARSKTQAGEKRDLLRVGSGVAHQLLTESLEQARRCLDKSRIVPNGEYCKEVFKRNII